MKMDMCSGKRGNEVAVTQNCKQLFVQCSGVGWLCRARQRLVNMMYIHWETHGEMTTKKVYNMILMHIMSTQPKDAVYNIEHFNLEVIKKMPYLMKTHLAEFLIYSNYIPYTLIEGIFPVSPIGQEYTDDYVPPMKTKLRYDDDGEEIEKDEFGCEAPKWKDELAKCKNFAQESTPDKDFLVKILDEINKYQVFDEILHTIHKLSTASDPCFHCVWLKHKLPGKVINCTSIPELCSMKYELFYA